MNPYTTRCRTLIEPLASAMEALQSLLDPFKEQPLNP